MADHDDGAKPDERADHDDGVDPDKGADPDNGAESGSEGRILMVFSSSFVCCFT